MKKYDISDNFRSRIHTIRVTFQWQEYKGHIAYEMGGNCRGLNVMDLDFDCMDEDDIARLVENDCSFRWNENYEVWQMELKDEEGNICECYDIEPRKINDYVVAIEIIDCRLENEN